MVEATSQLYRCIAPVQPWLYYLLETYQGQEKIVGIFFSIMYTMSKGNDLLSRLKLFRTAAWKLFQNVVCTIFTYEYIPPFAICTGLFTSEILFSNFSEIKEDEVRFLLK